MNLPPMHPAIVHLPIAFVVLSFFADLFGRMTGRQSLRVIGLWSMLLAFGTTVFAIAAGYWDFNRATLDSQTRQLVELHLKVGWIILAGLFVLSFWRWRIRQQARRVVTRPYLLASFIVFGMTLFQGWFGGEMVYSQGAGVAAAGQGTEEAENAQERLARIHDALTPGTAMGRPGRKSQQQQGTGQSQKNE